MPRSRAAQEFREPHDTYDGWGKFNRHYWVEHYEDFLEFFFSQCLTEPHSTKPHEDTVGWGLETDAQTLVATQLAPRLRDEADVRALLSRIDCPILVIHGSDDHVRPCASGARLAELANGTSSPSWKRSGHLPHARDPVKVNLLLRDFIAIHREDRGMTAVFESRDPAPAPRSLDAGPRPRKRRRPLHLVADRPRSCPARRRHRRRAAQAPSRPRDRLAGPARRSRPSSRTRGERIHPLSAELASESAHITAESSEHDLNAFQAIRRMDEILVANFMVFHDAVEGGEYDLVIGDEAWDIDHFLHENPELKSDGLRLDDRLRRLAADARRAASARRS